VALVEVMDLAFSIDNVFAAVAFTDHLFLIYTGVFIGILAMRFVAQAFVKLMEKFTFLETIAFIVIGVLGVKLTSSLFTHFYPESPISHAIESEKTDLFVSLFTVAIFIIPVLTSLLFNFPKRHTVEPDVAEAAEKVLDKS
jgi:predicted tellurium resistance membrane protein TerC